MSEYMAKHFVFTNFTTPVPGTSREVLENYTTTRYKSYLNGLGIKKCESGGVYMMMKTGMEMTQYYNVFNYGPPRPQK